MTWAAVAVGGALGSLARYALGLAALRLWPAASWSATFAVNIIGSFAAGYLLARLTHTGLFQDSTARAFVFVGVLGGFTTFSAFALDTLLLAQGGAIGRAALNAVGQLLLGMTAVYLGWRLG